MKKRTSQAGFSLVEVALAMGVAAFCLISLLGMLTVGLTSSQTSTNETQATHLMNQIADDLQVASASLLTTTPLLTSPLYGVTLPTGAGLNTLGNSTTPSTTLLLTSDGMVSTATTVPVFQATIGFMTPATMTGASTGTTVRILVTWPAQGNTHPTAWPTSISPPQYTGSVETVFVLDKN